MKTINTILISGFAALFMASCGQPDQKAKLQQLIVERNKLNDEIQKLQTELEKSGDSAAVNDNTRTVNVTEVVPTVFRHFVDVQAKVDAELSVNANPKMGGTVMQINVKEGDPVKAGQILATMDDQVLRNTINEVQGQLDFAINIYNKQKALWDQKVGSEVQYLTAKNNKESLERKITTLREQAEMMKVKSPIDGTVDNIYIKIGQAIMPGMPCINVVNLAGLKVKAEVAEGYIGKIKAGDGVVVYFPDLKKEIESKVAFVSSVVNNVSRSFTVEVRLTGNNNDLKPNMVAVMRINDYKTDSAIAIPVNAVQTSADGSFVFVAETENGKTIARKKLIETGKSYQSIVEIVSGLAAGDKLITAGQSELNDGEVISL